jgi:hypothetical protein
MQSIVYTRQAKEMLTYFTGYSIPCYEVIDKELNMCSEVYGNLEAVEARVQELNEAGGNYCFNRVGR